jgi:deazaflavin-dependent oxidoreductase (nitroreductase family)
VLDRERILTRNAANIAEFRSSGGRLAAFGNAPLLLLTTIGARSGQPRTTPMMYLADEHDPDRVHVFATYAGADTNPAWFHNLVAHPDDVRVEIGTQAMTATATVLPEPHRSEVYAVQARRYPRFSEYETRTKRSIPVVALTLHRQPGAGGPR